MSARPRQDSSRTARGPRVGGPSPGTHEQAGELVREQSDQFAAIIRTTSDGFVKVDTLGRIVAVNDAYCQMTGYTHDELLGRPVIGVLAVEGPQQVTPHAERVRHTGFDRFRTRQRRKDGTELDVEVSASCLPNQEIIAFFRDITDRLAAEQSVLEAAAYTRSLIEASLDPLVTIGPDGTITDVNEATVRATGVARPALIGSNFASYFTDPAAAAADYRAVFEQGTVTDFPLTIRRVDGTLVDVLYNASVYRDNDGRVLGVFAAARDVTERVAAEEALRAANRRLSLLSETSQRLVRWPDESDVLREVCVAMTTVGGYRLAWIGEAVEAEGKPVRPLGQAGFEHGYLERAQLTWDDQNERGRGPTGRAIRDRTLQYCRDFLRDPAMRPWRAAAIEQGYGSSVSVPFSAADEVFVLNVYADRPDGFSDGDLRSLRQIADDLATGIAARRVNAAAEAAHARLRESEEKYRFISELSSEVIIVHDLDGRLSYTNEAAVRLFGLTRDELLSFPITALIASEHHDRFRRREVVRETGDTSVLTYEVDLLTGSGVRVPFEVRSTPVIKDGRVTAVQLVARDLTERRRAEAVLRESEEQSRLLFDRSPVGIAYVALDGRFVRVNRRFGEITGYGHELERMSFQDITHPEDLQSDLDHVHGLVASEIDSYTMEKRYIREDGSTVWVDLFVTLVRDDAGNPLHFVSAIQDIDGRKRAEAEVLALTASLEARVESRTAELRQANESLQAFAYTVSHDLRAPLRALSGFSEILEGEYSDRMDERARGYTRRIRAAAVRMAALLDDLVELSRLTRAEIRTEPVDLSRIAHRIAAQLHAQAPERAVEFDIQDGVMVEADPRLITTVLQNLLENAWKFTAGRERAHIRFSAVTAATGEVSCSVRDDGVGFDPDYAGSLFEPFQRLHTASEYPGTGIGLASVRRVIERHHGTVRAEGDLGTGATFSFTLPPRGE